MTRALSLIIAVVSMGWACTKPNPAYCNSTGDCASGEVCDLPTHTCVNPGENPDGGTTACAQNEQCSAQLPICGTDGACRACELDDECASGVCRADGACEDAANVLYVAPNAPAAGQCLASAPCDIYFAKSSATGERSTIRLANGTYALTADFIVSGILLKLTIVGGRGAAVQRSSSGPAFEVQGASELTLRGFTLNKGVRVLNGTLEVTRMLFENPPAEVRAWIDGQGGEIEVVDSELKSSTAAGILLTGVLRVSGTRVEASATDGIRTSSGDVTVRSSVVTRNKGIGIVSQSGPLTVDACTVSENLGGGISSTNGSFNITNNAVVHNGDPGVTGFGGLRLDSSEPVNRFQHNTVIRNDCDVNFMPVLAGGVYCVGAIASNNLIANNFRGNTSLANAQTGGSCDFGNSIISQTDATLGLAADGVHLTATSSAVNAGSASAVTTDIDGAARSDGMPDIGADEFQP